MTGVSAKRNPELWRAAIECALPVASAALTGARLWTEVASSGRHRDLSSHRLRVPSTHLRPLWRVGWLGICLFGGSYYLDA